jgi:asparagine synthase (glutamine-hydrolysing)
MSAIFGVYGLDGRPVRRDLTVMRDRLGHRGPEGSGVWTRDSVGMGHQLLMRSSPNDHQPLVKDDLGLVLTADARIDNRTELIGRLGLDAKDDGRLCDGDLILSAFKRWGDRAPEYLIGDFAFAIWDASRRMLFCARDPIGIRPFYYSYSPGRYFVFASEIKGILTYAEVPRRINESKIVDHLTHSFQDTQRTFYEDVVRLPPAHSVTVTQESVQLRRYWSLNCERDLRLANDNEYAEAFREQFVEAVRCRTSAAFSVGSTLSGGLDSSSIACTANRFLAESQRELCTYSAIFPSLGEAELRRIDERMYVDIVLKSAKFNQTYVHADQSSPLDDWAHVSSHLGDACLAPNLYIHWALYKAAAAKGVRVLLDGLDGDTTVSHGLAYLTDLVRAGRWIRFGREATALSQINPVSYPLSTVVWELGVRPLNPRALVRIRRALQARKTESTEADGVTSHALMERMRSRSEAITSHGEHVSSNTARRSHWRALTSPLIPYAMEFADAASSAFNLEVRYPFFDRRLMEFCLAIPPAQKLQGGWTRSVMRRAMGGIVPREIQWRPGKADLAPNFTRGLFERDHATIRDVVFSGLDSLREYVNVEAVRSAYQRWAAQPKQHQRDALALFSVTTLAIWFESAKVGPAKGSVPPAT